jgi:cytochrome c553
VAARERGTLKTYNPWPRIGWGGSAVIIVVAGVLGFVVLDRYQQGGPDLDVWSAICRGLGITSDTGPASEPQPPLRTPTRIAWTSSVLDQIAAGDAQHGAFIGLNCTACHGDHGVSQSGTYPTLAGLDAALVYKQLEDFRSGKRSWGAMNAIAQALSLQDSADVAAYFATQPGGLPALSGNRVPEAGRSLRQVDPAKRLVFAGDPQRGIPPCSACHGPGGYKLGAPALQGQQAAYIERQLASFAQGIRQNDIFEQMRIIARGLTPDEMHAVAALYGSRTSASGAGGLALR